MQTKISAIVLLPTLFFLASLPAAAMPTAALGPLAAAREAAPLTTFRLAPDEIDASSLLGGELVTRNGARLGPIADLLCDTDRHRIAFIALREQNSLVAIRWVGLSRAARSGIMAESPNPLATAEPFEQALNDHPTFLDVRHGLIGRPVLAANGAVIGKMSELVVNARTGAVVKFLIEIAAAPKAVKAMPWNAIADLFLEHAVVLRLERSQIAALPRLVRRGPLPMPAYSSRKIFGWRSGAAEDRSSAADAQAAIRRANPS